VFDEGHERSYVVSAIRAELKPIWIGCDGVEEHDGGVLAGDEGRVEDVMECIAARRKCNSSWRRVDCWRGCRHSNRSSSYVFKAKSLYNCRLAGQQTYMGHRYSEVIRCKLRG